MKINIKIVIFLIILILLSAILPVVYHYRDKKIQSLPDHITYNAAIRDSFPKSIRKKAAENNCQGIIIPVQKIKNNKVSDLDYIKQDVNLALAAYEDWVLAADKNTRLKIKKRFQKNIHKWKEFMDGDELKRKLNIQKNALPDYSAEVKVDKIDSKETDVRLILFVYNEESQLMAFKVFSQFTHPQTIEKWNEQIAEDKKDLAKLKKSSDLSLKILYILVLILFLYIIISTIRTIYINYQIKKTKKYLLSEIEKREDLFNNGHFVTVLELSDKYLKYFPHDTDINAFRERLLDFTNNDPKKAQEAYVKAKKLQMRLKTHADNFDKLFLTQQEKDDITALLPYNPKLAKNYKKIEEIEQREIKRVEFKPKIKEVKSLIKEGKLNEADDVVEDLLFDYPEQVDLEELSEKIEEKKNKYSKKFINIEKQLMNGNIKEAIKNLEDVLKNYSDMPQALELQNKLLSNKDIRHINLSSKIHSKNLEILFYNEIMIGREDVDVAPDIVINDKRISRPHLKITISNNDIIAEDQNSSAGTFINAEKIISEKVQEDNVITLAKIFDFKVKIYRDNSQLESIILSSKDTDYLIVPESLKGSIMGDKINLTADKFSIYNYDGISVFVSEGNYYVLSEGVELMINNKKFKVEVIS